MCLHQYHEGQDTPATPPSEVCDLDHSRVCDDLAEVCDLDPGFVEEATQMRDRLTLNGRDFNVRKDIGERLYKIAAGTSVGRVWLDRCAALQDANESMRTYFRVDPEELWDLPWELMHDDSHEPPFRADGHRPMRGYPDPTGDDQEADPQLPINVLIVICDMPPNDREMGSPEAEVDAIFAALKDQPGIWHVTVLRQPDRDQLSGKIDDIRPQILHFIGDTETAGDPSFTITRPEERHSYPASELDRLLPWNFRPRLLILNGCRTTQMLAHANSRDLATRAVITNQTIVYGPPAVHFSGAFYRYLAQSGKVDDAMWRTRDELYRRAPVDRHYWGIPVLTVYGSPDTIFRQDLQQVAAAAPGLIDADDFKNVKLLVDRLDPSRQVWQRSTGGEHKRMVLITGLKRSGKSQLLHSCLLTWRLRGHPAILVDTKRMDYLGDDSRNRAGLREILLNICDSLDNLSAASEIRADLQQLKQKIERTDHRGLGNLEDPNPFRTLCQEFFAITKRMTGPRVPLMIAFDHVDLMMPQQLSNQVKECLLLPIMDPEIAGHTYAVIAIIESDFYERMLGWSMSETPWDSAVEVVPLDSIPADEAMPLSREYGVRKGWLERQTRQGEPVMPEWIRWLGNREELKQKWLPSELPKLAGMFGQGRLW